MIVLKLEKGGLACVLETDGETVRLASSLPFPPGAPLLAALEAGPGTLHIKVRGSRRAAAPEAVAALARAHGSELPFLVEGRTFNLTREQRAFLLGEPERVAGSERDER